MEKTKETQEKMQKLFQREIDKKNEVIVGVTNILQSYYKDIEYLKSQAQELKGEEVNPEVKEEVKEVKEVKENKEK